MVSYGNGADFSKNVDSLLDIGDTLLTVGAISIATLTASIIIAITFPEAAIMMTFLEKMGVTAIMMTFLEKMGVTAIGMSPFAAAALILKYVTTVNSARSQYNSLTSIY